MTDQMVEIMDVVENINKVKYAGFWIRFFAGILDVLVILLSLGLIAILFLLYISKYDLLIIDTYPIISVSVIFLCLFGYPWLYNALFYCSRWQGTPGMRALNIKICDYDYQRVSFLKATGRHFAAEIISGLTFGIGYLIIVFSKKKQALHDKVAHTYIIRD
jgi:uncharacterized RDD family membrane protein YckC